MPVHPSPAARTEIIPYLFLRDVPAALDRLARAFGFTLELRHAKDHGMHAQMTLGERRIIIGQGGKECRMLSPSETDAAAAGIFIYLKNVNAHYARARDAGAENVQVPHDEPYGRTYTARDLDGHSWLFTITPS